MNKLDIALKLLRLLNERKAINSAVVAEHLDVSLRTAQRYLLELSTLPCVVSDERNHTYALADDYPLKAALLRNPASVPAAATAEGEDDCTPLLRERVCLACGHGRDRFPELALLPHGSVRHRDTRQIIGQLLHLVKTRLPHHKCGFP
jgi:hypothetical protein